MNGYYSEEGSATLRGHLDSTHRRLQQQQANPGTELLFLIFGAMIIIVSFSVARSYSITQQQEETRREELRRQKEQQAVKEVEKHRKQLISAFQRKDLVKVIQAADIQVSADVEVGPSGQDNADIETCSVGEETERERETLEDTESEIVPTAAIYGADKDLENTTTGNTTSSDANEVIGSGARSTDDSGHDTPREGDFGKTLTITREDVPISVPITCAICLESYTEGQKVLLSGNSSCTHAFHQECILDYLVRYEKDEGTCPCCRQIFMPKQTIKRGGWKKPGTT